MNVPDGPACFELIVICVSSYLYQIDAFFKMKLQLIMCFIACSGTSEYVNNISDDEEDDVEEVNLAPTRKLTFDVWLKMTKMLVRGEWKAYCNYCNKPLSASSKSGTSHLRDHLKIYTQRVLKLKSKEGKTLSQSSLRMTAQANGKVNVDNYTFDQDTTREELGNMIVLHDYPLSIVDHAGFRRFVHVVQPLFNLHTRNTIRFVH
jgi:hypothetical protein